MSEVGAWVGEVGEVRWVSGWVRWVGEVGG